MRVMGGCGGRDLTGTGTELGALQQNMSHDPGNIRQSEVKMILGKAEILTGLIRGTRMITEDTVKDPEGDTKTVIETGREIGKT